MEDIRFKRFCYICGRVFDDHIMKADLVKFEGSGVSILEECLMLSQLDFMRYAVGANYPVDGEEGRHDIETRYDRPSGKFVRGKPA